MKHQYVIAVAAGLVLIAIMAPTVAAQQTTVEKFDSLFTIASSGAIMYRDMVDPAKDSLAAMGTDVVPLLIDKFTTNSARARWAIIHILKRIGSPAVPSLVRALDREDGKIVSRVCWALGDIKDSTAVEPLVGVVDHDRWQVRDQALLALGKIGDSSRGAAQAATAALVDTIPQVRKSAAVACRKLKVADAAPRLVAMLGDDFYGARWSAFHTLETFDTGLVVGLTAAALPEARGLQYTIACRLLAAHGTDQAFQVLLEQTLSPDPIRVAHAAEAIVRGDPDDLCGFHALIDQRVTDRLTRLKLSSAKAAHHESGASKE